MEKTIDLHTHTVYSDGIFTTEELVKAVAAAGTKIMSKTDHDTTEGISEAIDEGKKYGLIVVPGVELTVQKYHVLALGIDRSNKDFQNLLAENRNIRVERNKESVRKLNELGYELSLDNVLKYTKCTANKLSTAHALVMNTANHRLLNEKFGRINEIDILKEYLREGKPAHVSRHCFPAIHPRRGIEAILSAGGLPIIAHPTKDIADVEELEVLRSYGLKGVEVQPNFLDGAKYEWFARKYNLLITYGSDFHDPRKKRPLLGLRAKGSEILIEELTKRIKYDN
ncbi:PHP domain-containing protein [Candidatus Woesearchaeota archaeon]|nr:PHP domain-containing protein [Candidatus Woesearchaeota archaeon]